LGLLFLNEDNIRMKSLEKLSFNHIGLGSVSFCVNYGNCSIRVGYAKIRFVFNGSMSFAGVIPKALLQYIDWLKLQFGYLFLPEQQFISVFSERYLLLASKPMRRAWAVLNTKVAPIYPSFLCPCILA